MDDAFGFMYGDDIKSWRFTIPSHWLWHTQCWLWWIGVSGLDGEGQWLPVVGFKGGWGWQRVDSWTDMCLSYPSRCDSCCQRHLFSTHGHILKNIQKRLIRRLFPFSDTSLKCRVNSGRAKLLFWPIYFRPLNLPAAWSYVTQNDASSAHHQISAENHRRRKYFSIKICICKNFVFFFFQKIHKLIYIYIYFCLGKRVVIRHPSYKLASSAPHMPTFNPPPRPPPCHSRDKWRFRHNA